MGIIHILKFQVSIRVIVHKLKMIFSFGSIVIFNDRPSLYIQSLPQLDVITAIQCYLLTIMYLSSQNQTFLISSTLC